MPQKKSTQKNKNQASGKKSKSTPQKGKGKAKSASKSASGKSTSQAGSAERVKNPPDEMAIAGLGASAGGLEAFNDFLSEVPADAGIAYLLVQHMDPTQRSNLAEILARKSAIPVQTAANGMQIEPDTAYVMPPGENMMINQGRIVLEKRQREPGLTHSIDILFKSLAEDRKERAIGIILSGTGNDGVSGAKAIKSEMGIVMVQDPETARYSAMPGAAISAHVEDFVLPSREMGKHLREYINQLNRQETATPKTELDKDTPELKNILSLVRTKTGHDFSGYKSSSIIRRIQRRMGVNQIDSVPDYAHFVHQHPAEVQALMKDFLINVTSFFRDAGAYDLLKKEMMAMIKERPEGSALRAWVPGCSTGEEAFSIAILLIECASELKRRYEIQVFGSDLDEDAIGVARASIYPVTIAGDMSEERLNNYFNRVENGFQVKRDIRERVIFAVHDVTRDPPYSRTDVISSRNLLIYFDNQIQRKIIPMFHYSLNDGGILFLGTAETVGEFSELFETVSRKWRIYKATNAHKKSEMVPPPPLRWRDLLSPIYRALPRPYAHPSVEGQVRPQPEYEPGHLLLQALPPAVVVNWDYQVIYTHGNTGKYLHLPEGAPDMHLLQMVIPELHAPLNSALQQISQGAKSISKESNRIKINGDSQYVRLSVHQADENYMVITFEDQPKRKRRKKTVSQEGEARVKELEQELQYTQETLRSTMEELETANEELRSANEEYQSTNEELQSTNEELETSREELQSSNEELMTINQEYQQKIEELERVNDDMNNLINSTEIATIFLDTEMRIQRFTPPATKIFNFAESDAGRPVTDITTRLKVTDLLDSLRQVRDHLTPVQQDVETDSGKWYSMRIYPYRTGDNTIAGLVVSFMDITNTRQALAYAESIVDTVREPLLVLDENLTVATANRAFYQQFQTASENTEGKLIYHLGNRQWDIPELNKLLEEILADNTTVEGYRVEHEFPQIGRRVMMLNARRLIDQSDGRSEHILLAIEDVTGRE